MEAMIKDVMLAMMSAVMPYMIYVSYLGVVIAGLGLLFLIISLVTGSMGGLAHLMGKILLYVAGFFFACELAGWYLGAAPSLNLGDENKFEFILVRFWQLGLGAMVIGLIYIMAGNRSSDTVDA